MFSEVLNLEDEERELRELARRHGVPLDFAETIRDEFRRFDSEGNGYLGYHDFANVVRTMTLRRTPGISTKDPQEIPDSRIRLLWHDVDQDHSGKVELEEFLVWFCTNFCELGETPGPSMHSDRAADSITERFYASMGRSRLKRVQPALRMT